MDGSTHGKGTLRFVKNSSKDKKSSSRPFKKNHRVEKRRRLRLERRNQQLILLWRFLIFSAITYLLVLLVINNGWSSIDVEQIYVKGSNKIQANTIIMASNLNLPKPLFAINPEQLEISLIKELPIMNVQIRRRLIPPRLEIELKERKPIAFANRRGAKGKEQGMLDSNGDWMPIKMANQTELPRKKIYVEGWMASHRNLISIILDNDEKLGSPLKKITVSPNGELSLETEIFESIHLGSNSFYIKEQIKALNQLSKNLPSKLINKAGTTLDIRDPSKPELQMPSN